MNLRSYLPGLLSAALLTFATQANAVEYSFFNLSSNYGGSNLVANQLKMDVNAVSTTGVSFKFTNVGTIASSITDIYFEDTSPYRFHSTAASVSVLNSAGVEFAQGAAPGNLPSSNAVSPAFQVTGGLSADSNSPTQPNGVNNTPTTTGQEWVTITLTLLSGQTFSNVLSDLGNGGIRVGLKVQGLPGGQSDAFLNKPGTPPPPPPPGVPDSGSTAVLFGIAGAAMVAISRRLRRTA